MENKMITIQAVQKKLQISDQQMKKILHTMKKRHAKDEWIIERIVGNHTQRYMKLEALEWINTVYMRKDQRNYLEAEIEFAQKQILRLENELKDHSLPSPYFDVIQDMSVKELAQYLGRSRASIYQALQRMEEENIVDLHKYGRRIEVSPKEIKWIIEHCFRQVHLMKLDGYKRMLQQIKQRRSL